MYGAWGNYVHSYNQPDFFGVESCSIHAVDKLTLKNVAQIPAFVSEKRQAGKFSLYSKRSPMALHLETDVTSVSIHLNELRNQFDQCLRNGETFANVRKLYMQIKELECALKALIWDPRMHGSHSTQQFTS